MAESCPRSKLPVKARTNRRWYVACVVIELSLVTGRIPAQSVDTPYAFTTLAGDSGYGSNDGVGVGARFWKPLGVTMDSAGNVYVADTFNHTIRKMTPGGVVSTLAGLAGVPGSVDGMGSAARFYYPRGIAVDSAGSVFVADTFNQTIRMVSRTGWVTTLAGTAESGGSTDGTGSYARFSEPTGICVDSIGNLYVADAGNCTIRKVTTSGVVTTQAGLPGNRGAVDGLGSDARFNFPSAVAVDSLGNIMVADYFNNTIRKVTPEGMTTTLAGLTQDVGGDGYPDGGFADGLGSEGRFHQPQGVAVDNAGNVFVADTSNHSIRRIASTGVVTTIAGAPERLGNADGLGIAASFNFPYSVATDGRGNLVVADGGNCTIRRVGVDGEVDTIAGFVARHGSLDGNASSSRFYQPSGVALDRSGNLYVADSYNNTIRKIAAAGEVTTMAGLAEEKGSSDGIGTAARFARPSGVAVDPDGNLYVADAGNCTIRKVTSTLVVTTVAGLAGSTNGTDGAGTDARFNHPRGLTIDLAGNVWVADTSNHTIRKITPAGVVTTLAGKARAYGSGDGSGTEARFNSPSAVAVDSKGDLYVADTGNHTIRRVTPLGVVTTLAGTPGNSGSSDGPAATAQFWMPSGVALDANSNIFVADLGNQTIRRITPAGVVSTVGGLAGGSADGTGAAARFYFPSGLAVDATGNLYVADSNNHTIRVGFPAPTILGFGPGLGLNGGQFGFVLTGPAGRSVVVEASENLVNWLPLWTNTFTGNLNFSDSQSSAISNRFYRALVP